jgi:hypothetical protein
MAKKNLSCLWGVIFTILAFALMFFAAILQGHSQNVTRKGNVFIQDSSKIKKKDNPTLTPYTYKAADGTTYPIYMSSTGKCFIIRASGKTGKPYKQYLPEVTKQLSKK